MRARAASERRGLTRRWAVAALALLFPLSLLILRNAMSESTPPAREVTVLLTLDRTWWHRLGLSRFTYIGALRRAGARVRVFDESALVEGEDDRSVARRLLEGIDALVLSGGGDVDPALYGADRSLGRSVRPGRDRFELALLAEAEEREIPTLGICRGAQLLNVFRGGTLRTIRANEDLVRRHGKMRGHPVRLEPGSLLAEVFRTERLERVVSYHGQAVDAPGQGLVISGRAEDGVVEAVERAPEAPGVWLAGVQWHPELSRRSVEQRRLFAALVEAARGSSGGGEAPQPAKDPGGRE